MPAFSSALPQSHCTTVHKRAIGLALGNKPVFRVSNLFLAAGAHLPTSRLQVATVDTAQGSYEEAGTKANAQASKPLNFSSASTPLAIWTRVWMPASPASMLDTKRPNKITLLGRDLVAWFHQGMQSWEVVEDRCPHRFAPLSMGRIVDDHLTCSYHGWSFGSGGACANIPQLPSGPAKNKACKQRKACASAFPCVVNDGLLFVWMDNSVEGLLASTQTKPFTSSAQSNFDWIMAENPNDYTFWLEQGMDPTHAPFLHHGIGGFEMKNALEMVSNTVPEVSLEKGFTWRHEGYETRNKGMKAKRQFIPPFAVETSYNKQGSKSRSTQAFTSLVVPVRPGVSRTIFRFAVSPPPPEAPEKEPSSPNAEVDSSAQGSHTLPTSRADQSQQQQQQADMKLNLGRLLFSFIGRLKLPHWLFLAMELSDQDAMIMNAQERQILKAGLKPTDYALLASGADAGVAAMNRWIRMAGPPGQQWLMPRASLESVTEVPMEQLLDRRSRHVDHCATCQKGLQQVTQFCIALTGLAAVASTAAVAMLSVMLYTAPANGGVAAAAHQGGLPVLVAAVAGVGLALAAAKLWVFREDRFISGVKSWTKKGGLSLVRQ